MTASIIPILLALLAFVIGILNLVRPDLFLSFQTWSQKALWDSKYEPGLPAYRMVRVFGAFFVIIGLVFSSMIFTNGEPGLREQLFNYDQDLDKLPLVRVVVKLDSIWERAGGRPDLGLNEQRDFDFYLERPDLGLKQQDFKDAQGAVYTSDLPAALQPKMLYASDVSDEARNGGNSCDFGGFPHTCTLNLYTGEDAKPKTVLLKIVFADNTYAQQEVAIPYAGMLDTPAILEPKSAPKNGGRFGLKFRDVGADRYKISVSICHPYANNGINPCLNVNNFEYIFARQGGRLVEEGRDSYSPVITAADNIVEIWTGRSFNFSQDDTSAVYSIQAEAGGVTQDGVKTHRKSYAEATYDLR
ncbi:MAG: hypothetical protein Q7S09_05945 [bacterium]|nr:hypothetical protein [bacterium]